MKRVVRGISGPENKVVSGIVVQTQELKQYIKPGGPVTSESIDPNSGAWRIVFVVTEIICKDPSQNYTYGNNLDQKSVYQTNNSTGPET
jgi:hypothetical protein